MSKWGKTLFIFLEQQVKTNSQWYHDHVLDVTLREIGEISDWGYICFKTFTCLLVLKFYFMTSGTHDLESLVHEDWLIW